ncbi:MAG: NTP transferase domain-containing protein [Bacteroidota bacterium]
MNALILIGGKSTRMGSDKSSISYKGKIHRNYLAELLLTIGLEQVYFSCSEEQSKTLDLAYPIIVDQYLEIGPIGGVLSAIHYESDKAWLVVGCDYPLLGKETLQQLLNQRKTNADATIFQHPKSQILEPLIAIYEPSSFPKIKTAFQDRQYSLRKILQTLEFNYLHPSAPHQLMNANTPKERDKILAYLKKR